MYDIGCKIHILILSQCAGVHTSQVEDCSLECLLRHTLHTFGKSERLQSSEEAQNVFNSMKKARPVELASWGYLHLALGLIVLHSFEESHLASGFPKIYCMHMLNESLRPSQLRISIGAVPSKCALKLHSLENPSTWNIYSDPQLLW